METPKIFESEYRFCLILWEQEPVNSTKLVELCKAQLGWSKATTYTVKKGDTLWAISKKYLGNGAKYNLIFNANKGKIKNPNLIYVGQVLTIPAVK